jgi:uncharacterized damage-inducible protein DinB
MTVAALFAEFEKEMANTRKILECVPDDRFAWTPHEKSSSLGKLANHLAALIPAIGMTRAAVLRSRVISHMIHHRGQLSVYLRLLDVPVPVECMGLRRTRSRAG